MKLQINRVCDPRAISLLPPRTPGGSVRASALTDSLPAYGHRPQALQTFSLGGGGGGAAFLHPNQSGLAEASTVESVCGGLCFPTPTRHQGFGSHDGSSERMPPFPPSSASRAREGSQQQLAVVPNYTSHCWTPYLVDSRCQLNEDAERRFQQLASSIHKVGIVLDSVQNDAIRLNRAMKEASLDSGNIQKKVDLLENSLQQILKGQNDLKLLHEGSIMHNPDHLGVLNSHTRKLNEISSILSVWPEQVRADLRQLHVDIFRSFTKEMEGVARAIRSINSKTVAMQMLESCSSNERPQITENGSSLMIQMPAPSVYSTRGEDLKPTVKQENVKGAHSVCSSYMLAPKQKEASNQKVNTQEPTKALVSRIIDSDGDTGHISSVNLNTEPADLMKEAGGQEGPKLLRRARKKRRTTETICTDATALLTDRTGGGEKRRQEAEPEEEKGRAVHVAEAPAKRTRRPSSKYDAAQWVT